MIKYSHIILFLLLFIGVRVGFSQITETFIARSFTFQGTTLPYRLFIPANYSTTKKYPLVLTLHGVGESGTDNISQLLNTRLATSWADPVNQVNYPCFVLSPQTNSGWDNAPVMETINKILDTLINEFTIESNRLYVTGLSIGGIGTWAIMSRFPNRFAAAIPMCGGGDPSTVTSASITPIWNFHGTLDDIIPVGRSREMIAALESIGRTAVYTNCLLTDCQGLSDSEIDMHIKSHADLLYTEYEFGNHNIWDMSYDDPLLRPWVFDQYRATPGAITITNLDTLRTLSGIETVSWQSTGGNSVEIWYSANGGETWQLVSQSEPNTGSYQWDTRNFGDGALQLLNIFLKNNDGFIYSRDQSGYFTIDHQVNGTLDQTITFGSLAPVTYGASPLTLSATASSGLTVNYTSSRPSVATVSGNTVTIVGAGTATIIGSQNGNTNYNAAADVQQALTVNKATQSITFNPLTPVSFGSQPFDLTGQSSSGLSLNYSSSNALVATIIGNTVTIVGAGSVTIKASQSGNANYNAAADVQQALTVSKANQGITFNPLTPVYFGSLPFDLTGQSSSGLGLNYSSSNALVATIIGNTVTIVGAGPATIKALQSGNANYNAAADVQQVLTVNKANQSITFNPLTPVSFGSLPFAMTGQSSSGLSLNYSSSNALVAAISGNTVTIVGAGTATITALQSGNANYNAAADVQQALTVNKANQSIIFNPLTPVLFGSQPLYLTGQSSSSLGLSYSSSNTSVATISGNTVTIVGAGTATIKASQSGNTNYNAAADVPHNLTVNKANQKITFGTLAPVVDGASPFTLSATVSSGLTIYYTSSKVSVATISGNTVTIVKAGTATITASQSGNANYNAATDVQQLLTVDKANQTITFGALAPVIYGASPFTLSAKASSGLTIYYSSSKVSVATVSGNLVTIVGVGTTTITASQSGDAKYTVAADVQQTLSVNKANQTITFGALAPVIYGASPFTLSAKASSGLTIYYSSSKVSVATVSGNLVTIVGVGTTTITASQSGDAKNTVAADVQQTLSVNKANQSITFNSLASVVFGGQPIALTGQSSSGLNLSYLSSNTSVASVSGSTVAIVGAGTVTIKASQSGNANYNAAADVAGALIVNKAAQIISFTTILSVPESAGIITLVATSNSGLAINFSSNDALVATISGNTATLKGAGEVTFTAAQAGNANYKAAPSLTQSICILPNKPMTTTNFTNPAAPELTSSSGKGNQWFLNTNPIVGAVNTIYIATSPGIYTVQVTLKGCTSPASNEVAIIIAALKEPSLAQGLYPNPATNEIVYFISENSFMSIEIINDLGQSLKQLKDIREREIKIDISDLSAGSYILKVMQGDHLQAIRFIKK